MSKKTILLLVSLILITIIVGGIYGVVSKSNDLETIKAKPVQSTAIIVEHDNLNEYNTNGCWIYYQYTIAGTTYKHSQKYHGWQKEDNFFQNYSLPIVYFEENPDLSRLLITENEFEEFNIPQPDSLKKYNGRIR